MAALRALLFVALAVGSGCSGQAKPFAPSPIILPDAATIRVGDTQTFSVLYGVSVNFSLSYDGGAWAGVVAIDRTNLDPTSLRLVGLNPSQGNVYVTADVGPGRAPLVAVLAVR